MKADTETFNMKNKSNQMLNSSIIGSNIELGIARDLTIQYYHNTKVPIRKVFDLIM